ncbi:uroplakin-3a [Lissotriton helveticus]
MFSFRRLLPLWWAVLFVGSALGQEPAPQVVSPMRLANNPTLTTVALQKPVCVFDSAIRKDPASGGTLNYALYDVVLYGMQATAPDNTIGAGTFRSTSGGATAPYIVAQFAVPNCTALGGGASDDTLQQYLVRVGDNTTCLNDPNFSGICNPPLANNTAYRFVYRLINKASARIDQTLWSDQITTKAAKSSDSIDTWPGRRSGAMIVITSILSTLLFLLLAGFVAAVAANVLSGASDGVQTTRHETTVHQQAAPKAQASADPAYSSVIQGGASERYTVKPPQV